MVKKHKQIIGITIVLILAVIGYLLFVRNDKSSNELNSDQSSSSAQDSSGTDSLEAKNEDAKPKPAEPVTKESTGIFSDEYDIINADIQVFEVVYDGNQFLPNSLDLRFGDIVIFKNQSTKSFWPASNPHPTHTDYPEFNAQGAVAAGEKFDFKFVKAGTWKFHDHLNPAATGTITVTK